MFFVDGLLRETKDEDAHVALSFKDQILKENVYVGEVHSSLKVFFPILVFCFFVFTHIL